MNDITYKNLKKWIDTHLNFFPKHFISDDIDNMPESTLNMLLQKIYKAMGNKGNHDFTSTSYKIKDFNNINTLTLSSTLKFKIENIIDKREKYELEILKAKHPVIVWNDISSKMQNIFKHWVASTAKQFDRNFNSKIFDMLSDDIKVEFYYTLARQFGVNNYYDLKNFKIPLASMKSAITQLEISPQIQQAIYDVVNRREAGMRTITYSDMASDSWNTSLNIDIADSISDAEIKAKREDKKIEKKQIKFMARLRHAQNFNQYEILMQDPLFNRDAMDIIIDKFKTGKIFSNIYKGDEENAKKIIQLISTHELITTHDLNIIKNIKDTRGNFKYNSVYINIALSKQEDLDINTIIKLAKHQSYEVKLNILKHKKITDAIKNIVLETAIKYNNKKEQLTELFSEAGLTLDDRKQEIITTLRKKFATQDPLLFVKKIKEYGWINDLDDKVLNMLVLKISKLINSEYKKIESIFDNTLINSKLTEMLYLETENVLFLNADTKDIFLL